MSTNNPDTNYATRLGTRTTGPSGNCSGTVHTMGTTNKPSWQEMLIITFVRFSSCSKHLITIKKLRRHFALVAWIALVAHK